MRASVAEGLGYGALRVPERAEQEIAPFFELLMM
jgi:hypothetical protein